MNPVSFEVTVPRSWSSTKLPILRPALLQDTPCNPPGGGIVIMRQIRTRNENRVSAPQHRRKGLAKGVKVDLEATLPDDEA